MLKGLTPQESLVARTSSRFRGGHDSCLSLLYRSILSRIGIYWLAVLKSFESVKRGKIKPLLRPNFARYQWGLVGISQTLVSILLIKNLRCFRMSPSWYSLLGNLFPRLCEFENLLLRCRRSFTDSICSMGGFLGRFSRCRFDHASWCDQNSSSRRGYKIFEISALFAEIWAVKKFWNFHFKSEKKQKPPQVKFPTSDYYQLVVVFGPRKGLVHCGRVPGWEWFDHRHNLQLHFLFTNCSSVIGKFSYF